jgi:gluconolactonase
MRVYRNSVWFLCVFSLILGVVMMGAASAKEGVSVIAEGAEVVLLSEVFEFTEGPACDAAGNVFFTDQPNNKIYKWSVDGKLSVFHDKPGRANGLYFDKDGNLWACSDEKNELWKITPDGQSTVVIKDFQGKRFNGPNDLWFDTKGGIFFTDPFYKRPWWDHDTMPQPGQYVYYLTPDRKTVTPVATDLRQPNGIIGTPDGKTLYVADIGGKKTYRYAIQSDATLADKTLFCEMGSDGMTLDARGNVYLTGRGVTVFNSKGEQICQIPIDEGWTANVCFGGQDRKTLFITAMDSLYSIKMRVKGAY